MSVVEYLEALMLICFSISWYWSIGKMLQTKIAAGKSFYFVLMICSGYLFGIASKIFAWNESGVLSELVYLYCWNFLVTSFDAYLVVRYTPKSAKRKEALA